MSEIDDLVAKVASQLGAQVNQSSSSSNTDTDNTSSLPSKELDASDYPLYKKHPDLVKSASGEDLKDITFDNVLNNKIGPKDLRIAPDTLRMQGQIAKSAGRAAIQRNMQRAAELTKIPDARLLEMYGALRPYRSTKQELLDIADELLNKYNAKVCSNWFKEAADNYETRKKLKGDN